MIRQAVKEMAKVAILCWYTKIQYDAKKSKTVMPCDA